MYFQDYITCVVVYGDIWNMFLFGAFVLWFIYDVLLELSVIILNPVIYALALWGKFCQDVAGRNDNLKSNKDSAFTSDGKFTEDALRTIRLPDVSFFFIFHVLFIKYTEFYNSSNRNIVPNSPESCEPLMR